MSEQIEITVSPVQLALLEQAINFEILVDGAGSITAEPALKIFKRLIGVQVSKGMKGRHEALAIVRDLLAQCEEK